jgi:hypothetical protein
MSPVKTPLKKQTPEMLMDNVEMTARILSDMGKKYIETFDEIKELEDRYPSLCDPIFEEDDLSQKVFLRYDKLEKELRRLSDQIISNTDRLSNIASRQVDVMIKVSSYVPRFEFMELFNSFYKLVDRLLPADKIRQYELSVESMRLQFMQNNPGLLEQLSSPIAGGAHQLEDSDDYDLSKK